MQAPYTNLALDSGYEAQYHIGMHPLDLQLLGAQRLDALMKENGLSQQKLAKEARVTQAELSRFLAPLKGKKGLPITEGAAAKLGKRFDRPPTYFRIPEGSIDALLVGADPEDIEAIRRMAIIAAERRR